MISCDVEFLQCSLTATYKICIRNQFAQFQAKKNYELFRKCLHINYTSSECSL